MNNKITMPRFTILILLSLITQPAMTQQDLGMRITGDSERDFGLTISNWVNGNQASTLAPGLLNEQILPLDEIELKRQIQLERAASAPGAAINRKP